MRALLQNWNLFRVLRTFPAFAIIIQGAIETNYWIALAGLLLFITTLQNKGYCEPGTCAISKNESVYKIK